MSSILEKSGFSRIDTSEHCVNPSIT